MRRDAADLAAACRTLLPAAKEARARLEAGEEPALDAYVAGRTALARQLARPDARLTAGDADALRGALALDADLVRLLSARADAVRGRIEALAHARRSLATYRPAVAQGAAFVSRLT